MKKVNTATFDIEIPPKKTTPSGRILDSKTAPRTDLPVNGPTFDLII